MIIGCITHEVSEHWPEFFSVSACFPSFERGVWLESDGEIGSVLLTRQIRHLHLDRIFKPRFSMTGVIFQDWRRCQFRFCLMKNPILCRAARPESGREARERFLIEPLALNSSERRRRLALASGFRLLRSFGIDRLDAPAHAAGRG